jgi:hypothetical protein
MLKYIAVVLVVSFLVWAGAVKLQEVQNVPVARRIIAQKIDEFKSLGFDALAKRTGSGDIRENVLVQGGTFPVIYRIAQIPSGQANVQTVKISGRVECITLFPIGDFKTGPSFEVDISKDYSYQESSSEGLMQPQQ